MNRKEIFVDKDQMYALTVDKKGKYYIEVVCGGMAMENLVIPLNDEEIENYQLRGKSFLDDLSWDICKNRKKYEIRIIT